MTSSAAHANPYQTAIDWPTLETERLVLRGWGVDDVEPIRAIITDERAMRFIGGVERAEGAAFNAVARRIGMWVMRGFGPFAVERRDTGKMIGWIGPMFPAGWPEREIGWTLAPAHWGQGFATEAARAALRFAYDTLGWTTAISVIDPDNRGSRGVAERLGARLERRDVAITEFRADIWRHLAPGAFEARA